MTVVQAPAVEQAFTSTWAESPTPSQRVESTSHSISPRLWRAREVTVAPRHLSTVAVVSMPPEPVSLMIARMTG